MKESNRGLCHMEIFHSNDRSWHPRTIVPDSAEIELVISGEAQMHINGKVHKIYAGQFVWHRSGDKTIHTNKNNDNYSCLVLVFDSEDSSLFNFPRLSTWQGVISAQLFAEDIYQRYRQTNWRLQHSLNNYVYAFLALQATFIPIEPQSASTLQLGLTYIQQNYGSNMSVEDVAQSMGISVSHCHHMFISQLNQSPHQVILEKRLNRATEKLTSTVLQVKSVCYECGFLSSSGFSRAFKKKFGMTPAKYREMKKSLDSL